jgi:hypothetical protein
MVMTVVNNPSDLSAYVPYEVAADVDFNKYKAIAMACDSGATMPSSPAEGQWYLQVATGRKVLYIYENSMWNPMMGFGDLTYYVDGTDGTDSLDKGTAVDASAFKTIQYGVDAIPSICEGNVTVNVAAGTYNEQVEVGGKWLMNPTDDQIVIQGVALADIAPDISASADSYVRGYYGASPNYAVPAQMTDTGAFVAAAQEGKWWARNGSTTDYRLIYKNTADVLYVLDGVSTTCATYTVTALTTTITNSGTATRNVFVVRAGQQNVLIKYFNLVSTGSGQVTRAEYGSGATYYYCKITVGSGTSNITHQQCVTSYFYCYFYQTNAVATVGVNLGAVLRLWGCVLRWTSTSGYGVRNLGAFINTAELTTLYGYSSSYRQGFLLNNGAFCTIFQVYFDSMTNAVECDGVSWGAAQSEYNFGMTNVTYDFYKPLIARNNEVLIHINGAVEKEAMGYDAAGDYLYDELAEVKRIGTTASDYSQFDTTGHQTMVGNAKPWRDEYGELLGKKKQGVAITDNLDEGTTEFSRSAAVATDWIFTNVQLNHDKETAASIRPHLHWFQGAATTPNWMIKYRWQANGTKTTSTWTSATKSSNAFTWCSATLHQITSFKPIKPPSTSNLSDIVQFKIMRDVGNVSGLFGSADGLGGNAKAVMFDVHFQKNSLGSTDEYTK